jgi:hypothetical protein
MRKGAATLFEVLRLPSWLRSLRRLSLSGKEKAHMDTSKLRALGIALSLYSWACLADGTRIEEAEQLGEAAGAIAVGATPRSGGFVTQDGTLTCGGVEQCFGSGMTCECPSGDHCYCRDDSGGWIAAYCDDGGFTCYGNVDACNEECK